jgi:hypothetical protein
MGLIKNLIRYKRAVIVLIILFFIAFIFSRGRIYGSSDLEYGVTFSHKQAESLGLDWRETYLAMLDDLGVKKLRLSAYWDTIEAEPGRFDWEYLDWQLAEAEKRNLEIILAVGGRLPRWPECHFPEWGKVLNEEERQDAILNYIQATVNRYKDKKSIAYWQIENEPFLPNFGECPPLNKDFLLKEAELMRSLDSRPIMLTDSGELSLWVPAAKEADVFGTTMYLDTYSKKLDSYVHYPIEPGFFRFKRNIAKLFANPEKWIVIELQAEPWGPIPFQYLSEEERDRTMNPEKFEEIISFAHKTGFKEFYLWGLEWWYWEKTVNGDDTIWEAARKLYK